MMTSDDKSAGGYEITREDIEYYVLNIMNDETRSKWVDDNGKFLSDEELITKNGMIGLYNMIQNAQSGIMIFVAGFFDDVVERAFKRYNDKLSKNARRPGIETRVFIKTKWWIKILDEKMFLSKKKKTVVRAVERDIKRYEMVRQHILKQFDAGEKQYNSKHFDGETPLIYKDAFVRGYAISVYEIMFNSADKLLKSEKRSDDSFFSVLFGRWLKGYKKAKTEEEQCEYIENIFRYYDV